MLTSMKIRNSNGLHKTVIIFLKSFVTAYFLTVAVNTIRILISIQLYEKDISYGWFTPDRVHRIVGIAVYYIFLYLIYFFECKKIKKSLTKITPLFWYLLITLIVPIATGSYFLNPSKFIEHTIFVILIPFVIMKILSFCFKLKN